MSGFLKLDTQKHHDENTSQSMRNRIANTLSSSLNTFRQTAENAREDLQLRFHTPNNTNPDYIDFKFKLNQLNTILNKYKNYKHSTNKYENDANERKIKRELEPKLMEAFGNVHTAILVFLKNNVATNHTIAGGIADKFFEDLLESKGVFLDIKDKIAYTTKRSDYISSGGSYKTRRRRSLKKSRRVKRRRTKTMRKTRK